MTNSIEWESGKILKLELSKRASKALRSGDQVYVILELYFSCLIRKRVLCNKQPKEGIEYVKAGDNLYVAFSPVMTRACRVDQSDGPPELTEFPIKRRSAYLPKWLSLDLKDHQWTGEFGY